MAFHTFIILEAIAIVCAAVSVAIAFVIDDDDPVEELDFTCPESNMPSSSSLPPPASSSLSLSQDDTPLVHYASPNKCNVFYTCKDGLPQRDRCPDGLHYSAAMQICDFPTRAKCPLAENV